MFVTLERRPYPEYFPTGSYTKTIDGHEVTFNDVGYLKPGPAIVALSDWGHGIREFDAEMLLLMEHFRIIAVCFRGHGVNRDPVSDFGYAEHASDVLSLLNWLGVSQFVCLSSGQSSWAALNLAEMVGRHRMIGLMMFEFLMTPLSTHSQMQQNLLDMQSPQWRSAVLAYHQRYGVGISATTSGDPYYVRNVQELYMGGTGQETWARASRNIIHAYDTWITPLHRIESLSDPPLIHHLYGHPDSKEYESLHKDFKKKHPQWFSYHKKSCNSRYPHLEHQKTACEDTITLIRKAKMRPSS